MDKYEFNLKVEQIKKLASKKHFKEAAEIAKNMNWQKVRDWSTLAMIINVQEAVGDFLEARDMAILAYNRNLGGRKLVYKLTEILIKLKDFENADELYHEYEKMSQHDVNRFILLYHLRKAENASDNELVEILEEYKENEIDEKYMYELAKLYQKTGRRDECIKTCDDIVLWFQDGVYVEKTIELKQQYGIELTNTQKKILEATKKKEEDLDFTKEIMFKEQQQLARMQSDEIDEIFLEEDESPDHLEAENQGLKNQNSKSQDFSNQDVEQQVNDDQADGMNDTDDQGLEDQVLRNRNDLSNDSNNQDVANQSNSDHADDSEDQDDRFKDISVSSMDITKGFEQEEIKKQLEQNKTKVSVDDILSDKEDKYESKGIIEKEETPNLNVTGSNVSAIHFTPSEEGVKKTATGIDKANISLKELIANAKKKIEDSCEQINREEEENEMNSDSTEVEDNNSKSEGKQDQSDDMDIKVNVPNFDLYDTQNIQAALAQSLSQIMQDDEEEENALRPQPLVKNEVTQGQDDAEENQEDEQIEGQLSLADWLETVREEKYGKQHTRQYSKAELDRMLDEKDEKSAAYEKLIAAQKAKAKAEGTEFNEEEARRLAHVQMMIHAAKTDLAIRTGKATVKLEEAVTNLREAAVEMQKPSTKVPTKEQLDSEAEYTVTDEQISLNTAPIHPITDEIMSSVKQIMAEQEEVMKHTKDSVNEDSSSNGESSGEVYGSMNDSEESVQDMTSEDQMSDNSQMDSEDNDDVMIQDQQEEAEENELLIDNSDVDTDVLGQKGHKHRKLKDREAAATVGVQEVQEEEKKLSPELAKIFRKYREMPGLEAQLVDYFDSISAEMQMSASSTGNIIISGNSSSDKTDLARTLIRAINYLYPEHPKKIAKTTGESINHRGISKAMNKLKGTALIVEGAGSIQPKRVNEIMNCLDQDTERMIVIFEDSDTEMNVLLNFNPELPMKFNHRIVLKQYTVNELVEMARTFARKRQYEVDDDALLELYLKIDKLHNTNDNIKLDDIKEIINKAIIRSEKRASRRFFGGLKKKRGTNGDVIFLTEVDFKD